MYAEIPTPEQQWQFVRAYSPGMQEFIEGLTLYHFVRTGTVLSREGVQARLGGLPVSVGDYLLGLADLTGELMRLATNAAARGSDRPAGIVRVLQALAAGFGQLPARGLPDLDKKMEVMGASLRKVETLCYELRVRGAERPPQMLLAALDAGGRGGDDD
jgi:predicted translin family RNA/ssDNA-binding protein